jgi:hypothetical protein
MHCIPILACNSNAVSIMNVISFNRPNNHSSREHTMKTLSSLLLVQVQVFFICTLFLNQLLRYKYFTTWILPIRPHPVWTSAYLSPTGEASSSSQKHSFLTSALNRGEWSASCSGERAPGIHRVRDRIKRIQPSIKQVVLLTELSRGVLSSMRVARPCCIGGELAGRPTPRRSPQPVRCLH